MNGKEGVAGSSPAEGLADLQGFSYFVLIGSGGRGTPKEHRPVGPGRGSPVTALVRRPERLPSLRPATRSLPRRKQQHEDATTARPSECRVAWIRAVRTSPLLFANAAALLP